VCSPEMTERGDERRAERASRAARLPFLVPGTCSPERKGGGVGVCEHCAVV
jgi:hypothetical protein